MREPGRSALGSLRVRVLLRRAMPRAFLSHSMRCPEIGRSDTQVGRPRQRMIFAQMAGLLAMPTLLPESVLSAEGEDAQAVNSS